MIDTHDPPCRGCDEHIAIYAGLCCECLDHWPRCAHCQRPLYKERCPMDCLKSAQRKLEQTYWAGDGLLHEPETPEELQAEHESVSNIRW